MVLSVTPTPGARASHPRPLQPQAILAAGGHLLLTGVVMVQHACPASAVLVALSLYGFRFMLFYLIIVLFA